MSDVGDIEVPEGDAVEQSVPVVDVQVEPPVEVLSGDAEVPEADALEQHLPAHDDDGDAWR